MGWFGESWGAPVCNETEHTDTPEGPCTYCEEDFTETSQGILLPFSGGPDSPPELPYHHACLMQTLGIAPIVHVLYEGRPICNFTDKLPGEWHEQHKWVHPQDRKLATCPKCKRLA